MAAKQQQFGIQRLDALFAAEPDRLTRFSFEVAGIYFDWSKTHLNEDSLHASIASAEAAGFSAARDALFSGEAINVSEGRPATHVAERGSGSPEDVDLATARRQRTRALIDAIEAGAFGNVTGVLYDALCSDQFGAALLRTMVHGSGGTGEHGAFTGTALTALREVPADVTLVPRLTSAEQTNSSIVYADRLVLKIFRVIEDGPSLEYEVGHFLASLHIKECQGSPARSNTRRA